MKIQQMNGRQYFITLPNQLVKFVGWDKGDELELVQGEKGKLILQRK